MDPLYVVTVIFNPRRFESRYRLYREFKKYIHDSGAKLLTVEIAFGDRPFEVTCHDDPWNLQLRTEQEIWHKERGINLGFQKLLQLVPDARYIAWIDADVKFSHPNWVQETIHALHHYCVVQPFSEAHNLDPDHKSMWKCPSIFRKFFDIGYHQEPPVPLDYVANGHPGLAWAARRETLDQLGGLIDFCIAGSGDTHMANALMGNVHLNTKPGMTEGFKEALDLWADRCDKYVRKNVGFLEGICFHYWHGKSEDRGYEKRWDIMCFHQFDPLTDIYAGLNGLYKLTEEKPHLRYDLRRSACQRNEDSTELPDWYKDTNR